MNATSESRPRVFLTQDASHNYSAAEKFGDIVIVSTTELVPWSASFSNQKVITGMFDVLRDYRPGVDYILPSGSPLAIITVAHMISNRGDRHLYLKWDARANEYFIYNVEMSTLGV